MWTLYENIVVLSFAEAKPPVFREMPGKKWVMYGEQDDYPQYLLGLFNKSAKHNAIIRSKVNYIIGNGFEIMLDSEGKQVPAQSQKWIKNVNRFGEDLDCIARKCAFDKEIHGGYYLEIIWRNDKTCEIIHGDYIKYRSNADNTLFFYKKDGKFYASKDQPEEIPAFDPNKRKGKQILYYKDYRPGNDTYTLPPYIGAMNYILADIEVSKIVLQNAECGFMPSKLLNFNNGEPTDDEKKNIEKKIQRKFTGSEGKKLIISFNKNKETGVTVEDLGASDLTKEDFTAIDELIQQNIFVGHQVTNPMLMGIKTAGQLGGRNELREAFELFKNTYVSGTQDQIEDVFQILAIYNNVNEKLELKPVEPISFEFSEASISQNLLQSEIRSKIGAPELNTDSNPLALIVERLRLLPSKVSDAIIASLSENEMRALVGLEAKEENTADTQEEPGINKQKMSADDEISIFEQHGKKKDDYIIIKSRPVKFNSDADAVADEIIAHQTFELSKNEAYDRQKSILDLLKKKKTVSEIAKKLNITEAVVSGTVSQLVGKGVIDSGGVVIGSIQPPMATEISIKYSYEWKDIVPVDERDTPEHPSRAFCRKLIALNRLYTRQDIETISQKMGYSVWDRKGGWWTDKRNPRPPECRHTWVSQLVIKKA